MPPSDDHHRQRLSCPHNEVIFASPPFRAPASRVGRRPHPPLDVHVRMSVQTSRFAMGRVAPRERAPGPAPCLGPAPGALPSRASIDSPRGVGAPR